jgi:hypothetical protein
MKRTVPLVTPVRPAVVVLLPGGAATPGFPEADLGDGHESEASQADAHFDPALV